LTGSMSDGRHASLPLPSTRVCGVGGWTHKRFDVRRARLWPPRVRLALAGPAGKG
jgi:hypothetical protein